MATQVILAEQSVSITELRKQPAKYFLDEPVAVLANNKPAGYLVNAELFERMVRAYEQQQAVEGFRASFRPSAARLQKIATHGSELLQNATAEELENFSE